MSEIYSTLLRVSSFDNRHSSIAGGQSDHYELKLGKTYNYGDSWISGSTPRSKHNQISSFFGFRRQMLALRFEERRQAEPSILMNRKA